MKRIMISFLVPMIMAEAEAMELKNRFESLGLSTFYHILPNRGNEQAGYLPYSEYLKLVKRSNGILEIHVLDNKVTLRTFESLFLQKKTNYRQ